MDSWSPPRNREWRERMNGCVRSQHTVRATETRAIIPGMPKRAAPPADPDAVAAEPAAHEPTAFSQSLERGLMVLSSFSETRPVLGIADLSRAVGLNRSTTYRYVATLATLGYLQQ